MKTRAKPYKAKLDGVTPLAECPQTHALRPLPRGTLILPEAFLNTSTLITGQSGSGKSTRVVQPVLASLVEAGVSILHLDVTGTLGRWLRAKFQWVHGSDEGFVHVDPTLPGTHRFNPIPQTDAFHTLRPFVMSLDRPRVGQGSDSDFFRNQAVKVTVHMLQCLKRTVKGRPVTLADARDVVDGGASRLTRLAREGGSAALESYAADLESNQNARTTLMEIQNLIMMAWDPGVAAATACSDFSFDVLEDRPAIINLTVPESRARDLGAFYSCLLQAFTSHVTDTCERRQGPLRRPVMIVIDELPVVGNLRIDFINTLRKRRVGMIGAMQTVVQLQGAHGLAEARTLEAGFLNRILVPPVADEDASLAELQMGTMVVSRTVSGSQGETQYQEALSVPLMGRSEFNPLEHPELGPLITLRLKSLRIPAFQAYIEPIYRRRGWTVTRRLEQRLSWPPQRDDDSRASADRPRATDVPSAIGANPEPPAVADMELTVEAVRERWRSLKAVPGRWLQELEERTDPGQLRALARAIALRFLGHDPSAPGTAQKNWIAMEQHFHDKPAILLALVLELDASGLSVTDYFLGMVYGNSNNLEAVLRYAQFTALKRIQEKASREAEQGAHGGTSSTQEPVRPPIPPQVPEPGPPAPSAKPVPRPRKAPRPPRLGGKRRPRSRGGMDNGEGF